MAVGEPRTEARDAGAGPVLDVSMPLREGMPAMPGDPPVELRPLARLDAGSPFNLSRLTLGTHAGTHLDPPGHFLPGAPLADRLDLRLLNGECRVVRVPSRAGTISPAELERVPQGTKRVLLRTANSTRWARKLEYFADYVGLSLEGARLLLRRGVRLVGIDSLSIEHDLSERFPVHRELLGNGAVILEGLLLAGARPGRYELRCLPLRVQDGDGGPARAVLFPPA